MEEDAGLPEDQLRYILCIVLGYAVGGVTRFLPSVVWKQVVGLVTGLAFGWVCFGAPFAHMVASSTLAYVTMRAAPRAHGHVIAFATMFAYLSYIHIHRMWADYYAWKMDISGPMMILTLKVVALAYAVHDGSRKREQLTEEQAFLALRDVPGPLAYASYCFFAPGLLAGPFFEFREFSDSLATSRPSSLVPTLRKLAVSLALFGFVSVYSGGYDRDGIVSRWFVRDDYPALSYFVFCYVLMVMARVRYYAGFMIAEGAVNAAGMGYGVGKDGRAEWDRLANIDILGCEKATSISETTRAWNIGTATWLRRYVFMRTRGLSYSARLMSVYAVSAIWHGFYSGYYLFFVSIGVLQTVGSRFRYTVRPFFQHEDGTARWYKLPVYDAAGWLVTHAMYGYLGATFVVLSGREAFALWSNMYWVGHVLMVLGFVVTSVLPVRKRKRKPTDGKPKKDQ